MIRHLVLAMALVTASAQVCAAPIPAAIRAAVSAPARLPSDIERDADRKPAELMAFMGVKPGMRILDLYSGGGYFSELLSRVAGSNGLVLAHNNKPYLGFAQKDLALRDYPNRLPQVKILMAENNQLALAPGSLDMIWFSLGYHDLTLDEPKDGWTRINGDQFRAQLFSALKPGGVLAIIDHVAEAGTDPEITGHSVHRIDPAAVISQLTAAGFRLDASSDLLRNPGDDHKASVFDASIRGKTDRFVMRFRKPLRPRSQHQ